MTSWSSRLLSAFRDPKETFTAKMRRKLARATRVSTAVIDLGPQVQVGHNLVVESGAMLSIRSGEIGDDFFVGRGAVVRSPEAVIGRHVRIEAGASISPKRLRIGNAVRICPRVQCDDVGELVLDDYCCLGPATRVATAGVSRLLMGEHCWVGEAVYFDLSCDIALGRGVGVGAESMLWTHGEWGDVLDGMPAKREPLVVEDHVWITPRCIVLPGVRIGHHAILGTGAVVPKHLEPEMFYAGNPTKLIAPARGDTALDAAARAQLVVARLERLNERKLGRVERQAGFVYRVEVGGVRFLVVDGVTGSWCGLKPDRNGMILLVDHDAESRAAELPLVTVIDVMRKTYTQRLTAAERAFFAVTDGVMRFYKTP